MKFTNGPLALLPLILLALAVGCQKKEKRETTPAVQVEPALAVLAQSAYTVGDSVVIELSQPITGVKIVWDGAAQNIRPVANRLLVGSVGKRVGLHQLVVSGLTAAKEQVADTLTVDLWSDLKPASLDYSVLKSYPHQTGSFTQGLEFHRGIMYESTGLNGQSRLLKVDVPSGSILKLVALPAEFFGEGITIVDDRIYQLTWTSGQCFRYTLDFVQDKTYSYPTQGWGLTHRDTTLILSDGSNKLSFYDPRFQKTGELAVYDPKGPVLNLNELEYIDGYVLANVWQTNRIVQIDLTSGKVVGELNLAAVVPGNVNVQENVLNGIAYEPDERALYVTGKNWPLLFKLRVPNLTRPTRQTVAQR